MKEIGSSRCQKNDLCLLTTGRLMGVTVIGTRQSVPTKTRQCDGTVTAIVVSHSRGADHHPQNEPVTAIIVSHSRGAVQSS